MGSGRRGGGVWALGDRLKISCYESRSLFLPPEASRWRKGSKHNSRTCAPSGQGRSLIGGEGREGGGFFAADSFLRKWKMKDRNFCYRSSLLLAIYFKKISDALVNFENFFR